MQSAWACLAFERGRQVHVQLAVQHFFCLCQSERRTACQACGRIQQLPERLIKRHDSVGTDLSVQPRPPKRNHPCKNISVASGQSHDTRQ